MNNLNKQISKLAAVMAVAAMDAFSEERLQSKPAAERRRIVISIPERTLTLLEGERVLKTYDVAVGKATTPTPRGTFVVINRAVNPTWFGPAGPVAPGKDNPLGTRWMGLSAQGYGIHGTNVPSSIGKAASHGCIRMRQHDLEELFELVTIGTFVELKDDQELLTKQQELLAKSVSNQLSSQSVGKPVGQ